MADLEHIRVGIEPCLILGRHLHLFRAPVVGANNQLRAGDENLVRVTIGCTHAQVHHDRRTLEKFLLAYDHFRTGLVEKNELMLECLKASKVWFRTCCTVALEDEVGVSQQPLDINGLASTGWAFDNEERVSAANFLKHCQEAVRYGIPLERFDLGSQDRLDSPQLARQHICLLFAGAAANVVQVAPYVRDDLDVLLVCVYYGQGGASWKGGALGLI